MVKCLECPVAEVCRTFQKHKGEIKERRNKNDLSGIEIVWKEIDINYTECPLYEIVKE